MGIVLDFIIIAILVLSMILGYKKGLVNVIFNLCALVVAFIITVVLYKPITNFVIENTEFDEKIEEVIIEKGITSEEEETTDQNSFIEKYVTEAVNNAKNDVVKSSATIIAEKVVSIAVAIILFIVIRILLIFAKVLVNGLANLPVIKQCNEIGGLAYGILRGLIIIYAILAIILFVISSNGEGMVANMVESSIVTKSLFNIIF